ncbi:hypothetical protein D3C78_1365110 [compost metagenome]
MTALHRVVQTVIVQCGTAQAGAIGITALLAVPGVEAGRHIRGVSAEEAERNRYSHVNTAIFITVVAAAVLIEHAVADVFIAAVKAGLNRTILARTAPV